MMGKSKVFDEKDFEASDPRSRQELMKLFPWNGYTVSEHEGQFDIDMRLFKDGKHIGYIELGHKLDWRWEGSKAKFPFSTVHIEERKLRYRDKFDEGMKVMYVLFNKDFTQHLVIKGKDVWNGYREECKNIHNPDGGEFFLNTEVEKVKFNYFKK